jgi:hypothetical protein
MFACETELVDRLLRDEEWVRYFEFRGVDTDDGMGDGVGSGVKAKL